MVSKRGPYRPWFIATFERTGLTSYRHSISASWSSPDCRKHKPVPWVQVFDSSFFQISSSWTFCWSFTSLRMQNSALLCTAISWISSTTTKLNAHHALQLFLSCSLFCRSIFLLFLSFLIHLLVILPEWLASEFWIYPKSREAGRRFSIFDTQVYIQDDSGVCIFFFMGRIGAEKRFLPFPSDWQMG